MEETITPLTTLTYIFISFVLVALNAFFVASEFAIVKVRRTRLEELAGQGIASARISILCVDNLDEYLSATQLGITLVSLALGWIGEEAFYSAVILFFPSANIPHTLAHVLATGLSFFTLTLLHVVLGELVPKSMAIQRAEKITMALAGPLRVFYKVAKPLIHMFTWIANRVLKVLGYHNDDEPPVSEDELKLMMKESREDGIISESEAQIIARAFSFSDKRAIDIMISAEKVQYLSLNRTFDENMTLAQTRMHTRFPLTEKGFQTITGIVHLKDILHHLSNGADRDNHVFDRGKRPVLYVDPALPQDKLMRLFREKRAHLAIVQNPKTKENLGVVTMEDILEELVGEIHDEHGN